MPAIVLDHHVLSCLTQMVTVPTTSFEVARDFFLADPLGAQLFRLLEPRRYVHQENFWPYWGNTLDIIPAYRMAIARGDFGATPEYWGMQAHLEAMRFGLPTYYLTKDLCQALLRTHPPAEMPVGELHLPFPMFRVILEKGSYLLANGSEFASFYFGRTTGNISLPPNIVAEFPITAAYQCQVTPNWLIHSAGLEFTADKRELFFSYMNLPIPKVLTIGDFLPEQIRARCTSGASLLVDDPTTYDMAGLLINLCLFLSARPHHVTEERLQRKGRVKGSRKTDDLWQPRIIGLDFKPIRAVSTPSVPTGIKQRAHWRAGHWKDQAHGPLHGLRRRQWVEPYPVNYAAIN